MVLAVVRTVLVYGVLIGAIRLMGKRQIGQMEPSELVVTMLVADLAAAPIQEEGLTVLSAAVPIGIILILELILSTLSLRSLFWRKLLCGKPVILIENGKILQENLRATRVTLDELTGYLRQKDVLDITKVQYAILETGGSLSVFPFPEEMAASARDAGVTPQRQSLPVTVISDGIVMQGNLRKAGKDENWLRKELKARSATVEKTFLFAVDGDDRITYIRKCRQPKK